MFEQESQSQFQDQQQDQQDQSQDQDQHDQINFTTTTTYPQSSDDDSISQLNTNHFLFNSNRSDAYEEVISYVQIEEQKLINDYKRNEQLIPDAVKKGSCPLPVDKAAYKFFQKDGNSSFSFYLNQRRGSKQSIESTITHCAQFISYVKTKDIILKEKTDVLDILSTVCTRFPSFCHQHFDLLHQTHLQPSTILARIDSIVLLFEWIKINSNDMNIVKDMNDRLKIDRGHFKLMDKRYRKSNTLDKLINQREWVEEGMDGLLNMMKDSFSYFDSLVCLSCYQPLSCHQYSWSLGYSLATLWVLCMNARTGSIERLTMKDYRNIETKSFHLATDFKTSSSYSYQIINTTDIIGIFIKYIRPHIIPADIDSEESVVFPSFKGSPLCQGEASKKISNIFKRYGYSLTVTKIRAMVATHVEEKFYNEEITLEEYQTFIQDGQTHSIETHKKYYLKKRKYDRGVVIDSTFKKIFPQNDQLSNINDYYGDIGTPTSTSTTTTSTPTSTSSTSSDSRVFGLARTDINDMKKKFEWIPKEIELLRDYIQNVEPNLPITKNRYATCLFYFRNTAPLDVIQYFHPHHLHNSDRLKNGFIRALESIKG